MILATDAGNRLLVTFSLVSSQRLRMILRSVHGFELDDIQPLEFKKAVESGTGCEKADNIYIYVVYSNIIIYMFHNNIMNSNP